MNQDKKATPIKEIKMSQHQIVYLTNMIQKDIKLAEKKNYPVSESIQHLYRTLLENC